MKKNKKNKELQSRREFFKKAAKGMLPIFGAIVLSHVPEVMRASESCICAAGCQNTCSGRCSGTCDGSCKGTCNGRCIGTCYGGCKGTCTVSCANSCHRSSN